VKVFQVALGVLAAIGGFVDIGDLVFNAQAGATFGYQLLWVVVVGAVGIMVFAEMSGRVALVANRPVFETVRDRLGFGVGFATLLASQAVTLLTCCAEVGGLAYVLRLLSGYEVRPMVVVALVVLVASVWLLPFEGIERLYGFGGLLLLVFLIAWASSSPDWGAMAGGLVPNIPDSREWLIWAYFVVGVGSAAMMPYEVYFYSSGAVEDGWTPKGELGLNRVTAFGGFGLGALLAMSIMAASASVLQPRSIDPEFLGTVGMVAGQPLGELGLLAALVGIFFAIGGAAVDTALSGAYNLAQFLGWEWGRFRGPVQAPRFTLVWLGFFVIAAAVAMTGIDPVLITEYSVVFGVVAMPLTYLPVLLVANDRGYMGKHANGTLARILGWSYFAVIVLLALAAVPLLVLTNMGSG
jgi:manganese transport protein